MDFWLLFRNQNYVCVGLHYHIITWQQLVGAEEWLLALDVARAV